MQKSWLGCNIIIEKSVVACAVYHSFIDAIGAVYDWNLLFDSFPGEYIDKCLPGYLADSSCCLIVYSRKEWKLKSEWNKVALLLRRQGAFSHSKNAII